MFSSKSGQVLSVIALLALSLTTFPLPTNSQSPDGKTDLAIMFLVDESGGVNGKCSNPRKVYVVDQEGLRYDVIEFTMALLGKIQEEVEYLDVNIKVGVAQFSNDYRLALPVTPVSELYSPEVADEVQKMRNNRGELNTCYTNYPNALRQATHDLMAVEADKHILTLFTDGSFRGDENTPKDEKYHEEVSEEIESLLKDTKDKGIITYVFLLGRQECREDRFVNENECLNDREFKLRKLDLDKWDLWGSSDRGLISILDDNHPFRSIVENIEEIKQSLPYNGDWLQVGENHEGQALGAADSITVHMISAMSSASASYKATLTYNQVPERLNDEHDKYGRYMTRSFHTEKFSSGIKCQYHHWTVQVAQGKYGAYCWSDLGFRNPEILDLEAPKSIDLAQNVTKTTITASLRLDTNAADNSCYRIKIEAFRRPPTGQESTPVFTDTRPIKSEEEKFDIELPTGCPVYPLRVWVSIVSPNEGEENIISTKAITVGLHYQPQLGDISYCEDQGGSCDPQKQATIVIPVLYGAHICNPDFLPKISINGNDKSGKGGCPNPDLPHALKIEKSERYTLSAHDDGYTKTYVITLTPLTHLNNEGFLPCGWDTIEMTGEGFDEKLQIPTPQPPPPPGGCVAAALGILVATLSIARGKRR